MIQSGNLRGAAEAVRAANPLAGSCGRACPGEMLCGSACTRASLDQPIEIRRLHAFATDWEAGKKPRTPRAAAAGKVRVAVVGAGPAGIACAAELRRLGARVVVYEARNQVGGVLSDTIPLYRFPRGTAERDAALALGSRASEGAVEVRTRSTVVDLDALAKDFAAVFLAPGLGSPGPFLEGEELRGVERAEWFLARCRARKYRMPVGPVTVVIGGGNSAIDAALAALRCGREMSPGSSPRVHLLYRRTKAEMPAWEREVREAEALGVVVHPLVQPVEFEGKKGKLTGILLARMALGAAGRDGRPAPVRIEGSDFVFPCDQAILALGSVVEPGLAPALPRSRDGLLKVDAGTRRAAGRIYAGGDASGGEQTIVAAVRDGKAAARAIAVELGLVTAGEVSRG
jgi:NADPH-dependent glutamate synthase beta subunit-like oxidoreductase